MLAQMSKTIAEFFVFVDFYLNYTEPDSPHGDLSEGGAYLSESTLVWAYSRGA